MACKCFQKSSLVAVTTRDLTVTAGDYINFDYNRVHTGVSISHAEGSNIVRLNSPGLYLVAFDGNFTIGTAGSATVQLYNNGVAVPAAADVVSGTTAVPRGMHFVTVIEVKPSCCAVDNSAALSVSIDSIGVFDSAAITVVKQA